MAASVSIYNSVREYIADGTFDLNSDTLKIALLSSGYTYSASHTVFSSCAAFEVSNSGYTAGGQTLASVTWAEAGGVAMLSCADVTWGAIGSPLVARWAILYKSGTANGRTNPLLQAFLLNNLPADVTTDPGDYLTLRVPGTGLLTLS